MIVTLTSDQMLLAWRSCAGLESLTIDCSIERFDGIDINSRIRFLMRQWYLELLDSHDPLLLGPPVDVSNLVDIAARYPDGSAAIRFSPSLRVLSSIRLSDWLRPASVTDASLLANSIALHANPFARPGVCAPLAWRQHSDASVRITPVSASAQIVEANGYIDTGEDSFRLDSRALCTIESYLKSHPI